jgi:hypothetical protein
MNDELETILKGSGCDIVYDIIPTFIGDADEN